ncbi:PLP-dependent aminotransferase family protein [Caballeronia sp. LZ043]|nr:PLP-dependent aminotransferase family protein [Caballeronia sp. LZ043]
MKHRLDIALDRTADMPLTEQIYTGIASAIETGVLLPGGRLPSWLDLASQLGVSRGTVKSAYERLADQQLVVSSPHAGTRVADHPIKRSPDTRLENGETAPTAFRDFPSNIIGAFQNGVPASDCFPAALFARLRSRAARLETTSPLLYPDPHGAEELRRAISANLAISRGLECHPSQVFVTHGYSGALAFALHVLPINGREAWTENPGYFPARRALEIAGLQPVPISVDHDGIDVTCGERLAPNAGLALVTPGQQAPLGSTLSLARRCQLLEWARNRQAWIIEDDYLGELQLRRRAAPALASVDTAGRVIHIGSFSKTISPTLRLGFLISPPALVERFAEAAACFSPAPDPAVQLATAEFMRDGHYLRHLRKMKRVYASRSSALQHSLESKGYVVHPACLAIVLKLPDGLYDREIASRARQEGLSPVPLSIWYAGQATQRDNHGLLLGVATANEERIARDSHRLDRLIRGTG